MGAGKSHEGHSASWGVASSTGTPLLCARGLGSGRVATLLLKVPGKPAGDAPCWWELGRQVAEKPGSFHVLSLREAQPSCLGADHVGSAADH